MSTSSKIVWSEGLFLRPQHFQQERRYLERIVDERAKGVREFGWGFSNCELDFDLLAVGKVGLASANGVFKDGTTLSVPAHDFGPTPIDVSNDIKNEIVYLCIPATTAGQQELFVSEEENGLVAHRVEEFEVRDTASGLADNSALMQVAKLQPELRFESQVLDGYHTLAIAHVVECRSDKKVLVDESFIPPLLFSRVSRRLDGIVTDVRGLLKHRSESLAGRVSADGSGGASQIADFLMLQAINRYKPLVEHFSVATGPHPELLYQLLLQIAGELATFTSDDSLAPEFRTYDHDDLRATFDEVYQELRSSLGKIQEENAVAIPLKEYEQLNTFTAHVADASLLKNAQFVLAVMAELPQDQVASQFPALAKVASQESISEVVTKLLPGIPMRSLAVAPRQIRYHAGCVYFDFDTRDNLWADLDKTRTLAIHLGRKFPGLQLELWAIRR